MNAENLIIVFWDPFQIFLFLLTFLNNNPKEEIKKILDSEEIFISSLNSALEKSINNFIGDNEEEIDY